MKIFPFREESDSWPTASGNSVNCARSQKNMMKKRARISRTGGGERVQSQLPCEGWKSAKKRKKNKKCMKRKLTCKASSVGPLDSNRIHLLAPAAGLSQVQTVLVYRFIFLSKLSRGGFKKKKKKKEQLPVVFTGFALSSSSWRSA